MKIFKKILPIASIASVTAVVAPVATSCGGWIGLDYKNKIDPLPETPEPMQEKDVEPLYFDNVIKNKKIFTDDYYTVKASSTNADIEAHKRMYGNATGSLKTKISGFKIKKETHENKDYYLMSFTIEETVEINSEGKYQDEDLSYEHAKINEYMYFKWEYDSVPWTVRDGGQDHEVWGVQPYHAYTYGKWEVSTKRHDRMTVWGDTEYGAEKFTIFDTESDEIYKSDDQRPIIPIFIYQSHYLKNIKNASRH
ncbi:MAG: hypothetical protein KBS35_03120 [Mycoplasma sp.]|nr:hypothetical protein [Candidatus Hennigella equi]